MSIVSCRGTLVKREVTSNDTMKAALSVVAFNRLTKSNVSFSIESFFVKGCKDFARNFAVGWQNVPTPEIMGRRGALGL